MTRDGCACANGQCARCTGKPDVRAGLLRDMDVSVDVDELVTFGIAGDPEVRAVAVRRLAELARRPRA